MASPDEQYMLAGVVHTKTVPCLLCESVKDKKEQKKWATKLRKYFGY